MRAESIYLDHFHFVQGPVWCVEDSSQGSDVQVHFEALSVCLGSPVFWDHLRNCTPKCCMVIVVGIARPAEAEQTSMARSHYLSPRGNLSVPGFQRLWPWDLSCGES